MVCWIPGDAKRHRTQKKKKSKLIPLVKIQSYEQWYIPITMGLSLVMGIVFAVSYCF
jgi:hypothetical protein